jgi:hypothetical protein
MFSLTDAKSLIAKADDEESLLLLRYKMDQVEKFSGEGTCIYIYMCMFIYDETSLLLLRYKMDQVEKFSGDGTYMYIYSNYWYRYYFFYV